MQKASNKEERKAVEDIPFDDYVSNNVIVKDCADSRRIAFHLTYGRHVCSCAQVFLERIGMSQRCAFVLVSESSMQAKLAERFKEMLMKGNQGSSMLDFSRALDSEILHGKEKSMTEETLDALSDKSLVTEVSLRDNRLANRTAFG